MVKPAVCTAASCERTDERVPELATHIIVVTAPAEAARLHERELLCAGCAATAADAYIGYGWSIVVANAAGWEAEEAVRAAS